ncbi:Ctr copper transporter family-domain-containing protein [Geopyxis carbonaria]|nr:Ctr copper transporter family-domain-containing protein [Geopyxis carbonaria]
MYDHEDGTSVARTAIKPDVSLSLSTTTTTPTAAAAALLSSAIAAATADMEHSHKDTEHSSMAMTFVISPLNTPLLFKKIIPTTNGAAFGLWFGIFTVAVLFRGLLFTRFYLETVHWSPALRGGFDELGLKFQRRTLKGLSQEFSISRDLGRMGIALVTATVGYILMLVVMSFVVAWFFAVVVGEKYWMALALAGSYRWQFHASVNIVIGYESGYNAIGYCFWIYMIKLVTGYYYLTFRPEDVYKPHS